ncbi:immunoglobulin superfamily member 6 isoform X2 [Hyla sarda]|uniref:immunoglobulin superfamily member 6 isoform X2 n=1 Tax=Hyla sarda TaxID=327740 RepID=UPI0024C2D270|nr:immunoglobulin superfamily member 6 isoform X2 [Hyla sarda]
METSGLGGCVFLQFILLYYHCGVRSCTVSVDQAEFLEVLLDQVTANISCQYTHSVCAGEKKIYWFQYLASKHGEIKQSDRVTVKSEDGNTILKINNTRVQDSGIYICGIAFLGSSGPTLVFTGRGTTLTIREKPDVMVTPTNTVLIVLCTLLILYCIAVFSYYFIKTKCRIWKAIRNKPGFTMGAAKTFGTRSVFQAIAAEYHKKYDRKTPKKNPVVEDETIYQNTQDLH